MPIYPVKEKSKNGKEKIVVRNGKQKYLVRINYADQLGRAKQLTRVAYGSEEAKQLERELEAELKKQSPTARITLRKLYDEYMLSKKNEVRATSYDKTRRILERYVLAVHGSDSLTKLNVAAAQRWKQEIEALDIGITTRQNIFGEFRAMLNYAVRLEYIPKNPLATAGNFKSPLTEKKEMLFYTPEEWLQYKKAAFDICSEYEQKGDLLKWGYFIFFCIAFYTGMRKGEIGALTWNDIRDGVISVTKSVAQKLKGDDVVTPPKNRSSIRTLQIPKPLAEVLEEHHARCEAFDTFDDSYLICGGTKALRDSSVQKMNERFAKAAGLKVIRIHDFRHSHASLLANEGINIQEVARRLGHANIEMTWNTYSHLYPREEERAIKILDKIV